MVEARKVVAFNLILLVLPPPTLKEKPSLTLLPSKTTEKHLSGRIVRHISLHRLSMDVRTSWWSCGLEEITVKSSA